jgi:hypothetical protein
MIAITWTMLLDKVENGKESQSVHRCKVLDYRALWDTHMKPSQAKYVSDCLAEWILPFHTHLIAGPSLHKQTKALCVQAINTKCMKI